MGYYTTHTFEPLTDNEELKLKIIDDLRSSNEEAEIAFDDTGGAIDSVKWYDSDNDLKEFSKKYPDVVLSMFCEGEGNGDMYYQYFKDGKMQVCPAKITYDEYDEKELE